jgi:hypothetical protein
LLDVGRGRAAFVELPDGVDGVALQTSIRPSIEISPFGSTTAGDFANRVVQQAV